MSGDRIQLRYALMLGSFTLDVDLDVPLRGITGVFGASGSGKTTLLRCIAGLEHVQDGRLAVAGDVWQDGQAGVSRAVHERALGYVFQEPRLFAHLNVRANLDYGRRRRADGAPGIDLDDVVELLGLQALLERRPDDLSGGEAQRVAIGRALLAAPRFVLMDEPLASLDRARREEVLPFLDRLHAEARIPIVYVSHSADEICRLCDHLIVMQHGRAIADGDLQSVLARLDVPALAGEDAGSVLETTIVDYDADDDLTRLRFSGGDFLVPGNAGDAGAPLRLRIRANDVSLCRERPRDSTILNIVPAVIDELGQESGPTMLARLRVGNDALIARITRRSCRELDLGVGDAVLAQIKSAAVRNLPGESNLAARLDPPKGL